MNFNYSDIGAFVSDIKECNILQIPLSMCIHFYVICIKKKEKKINELYMICIHFIEAGHRWKYVHNICSVFVRAIRPLGVTLSKNVFSQVHTHVELSARESAAFWWEGSRPVGGGIFRDGRKSFEDVKVMLCHECFRNNERDSLSLLSRQVWKVVYLMVELWCRW